MLHYYYLTNAEAKSFFTGSEESSFFTQADNLMNLRRVKDTMKKSKYLKGFLGGGLMVLILSLAMVFSVFADDISSSETTLVLEENDTAITFDVVLKADQAFAGAEFAIAPSSGELVYESMSYQNEAIAAAGHVKKIRNGVLYFGFFEGDNVFEAGEYKVATLKYSYLGEEEASIMLASSKIAVVGIEGEGAEAEVYTEAHAGNSENFGVSIKRHRKTPAEKAVDAINALPTDITEADKEAVEAARAQYDALTDEEKAEIPAAVEAKLIAAAAKLAAGDAQTEADAVKDKLALTEAKLTLRLDVLYANLGGFTEAKYTADSYAAYKAALDAATETLAKADATLEELIKADTDLVAARDALVLKSANPMKVKATAKTVKVAKVKKKKQTVAPLKVTGAAGKVTYKKASGAKALTINSKTGKVTVKKGTKKGTYKIKVKVTAVGDGTYKKGTKTVTVTVKVK